MAKFKNGNDIVEAIAWNNNWFEVCDFIKPQTSKVFVSMKADDVNVLQVGTPDGVLEAELGDYIVKMSVGTFYPFRRKVFKRSYRFVK